MGKFIQDNGKVELGFINKPAGVINYQDYPLRDACRRPLPETAREEQFVHFHFMGFTSNQFIAGCSLSKSSQHTTIFFYLFDRKKGEIVLKKGCRVSPDTAEITLDPDKGTSYLAGRGLTASFINLPGKQERKLIIAIDGIETLNLTIDDQTTDTLRLCTPTGPNGWTYVQKIAGAKATGRLVWGDIDLDLASDRATAHYDFTAGFLRRDTFWNWACITGISETGDFIGLNISNGVNETGVSENVMWINGQMRAVNPVLFDYDLDNLTAPWRICDNTGQTDLTFTPGGVYSAYQPDSSNPTDFSQLFGTFNGYVADQKGDKIRITNLPGFTERQYSVWW